MGTPAAGKRYSIGEIHLFRVRDGRIVEHWHQHDRLGLCSSSAPGSEPRVALVIPSPEPVTRGFATSIDGTRIAWYRYGTADRAVVFVPTWNLVDARVVGHQVAALELHATVVTYDPRGAGASDRPEHGYTFPLHAADAIAVMDATSIERAPVVAASRGLNAAVLLATDAPQRIERIAAIAPYMQLEPDPEPPIRSASAPGEPTGAGSSIRSCTWSSRSPTPPRSSSR